MKKLQNSLGIAVPGGRSSALLVYTLSHAAVDLGCGYILYLTYADGRTEPTALAMLFILYNALAFGLQMFFGALCDVGIPCRALSFSGATMTAVGVLSAASSPLLAVCLAGVGNAAFHSGGGCDTLRHSNGMTESGIFVSSGALGLAVGMKLGTSRLIPSHAIAAVIFFAAVAIALCCKEANADGTPTPICRAPGSECTAREDKKALRRLPLIRNATAAAAICLFAILVRSYVGLIAPVAAFDGRFSFLYIPFCAFAGKFVGGVAADLLGARRVGVISLLLSAPLLLLGAKHGMLFLAATFLFNMAMPITLCALARRLLGHEGFAFGLNTLALLVGYLVSLISISDTVASTLAVILTLLAAASVLLAVGNERPSPTETNIDQAE